LSSTAAARSSASTRAPQPQRLEFNGNLTQGQRLEALEDLGIRTRHPLEKV